MHLAYLINNYDDRKEKVLLIFFYQHRKKKNKVLGPIFEIEVLRCLYVLKSTE